MTPDNTLLLIGGKLKILQKADALGLDVVYVQLPDQLTAAHLPHADHVLTCDYTDWDELRPLAQAAQDAWGVSAVLSLTEPGLDPAARVNDLLGLNGNSYEVSRRITDKWLMREHLAAVGARTIAAARVTGRDGLADFGDRHGYPFIVKPTAVTASLGVFRVDGPDELDAAWRRIGDLRAAGALQWADFFTVDEFLVEQYVPGPEFSVEAFSFDGHHVPVAITEKATLDDVFIEVGHALPARLDADTEAAVADAVVEFLDAIGLRRGPTHTEVKLGPDGPMVIESHNRVGGDHINELVAAAYDIDLDTYAIGWPFGRVAELTDRPRPRRAAATRFVFGEPGRVTTVTGADEVRADESVILLDLGVSPGDVVHPLRGNWDRLGQVAAVGPDTSAAVEACERLLGTITVATEA